jgi:hypothetical protein
LLLISVLKPMLNLEPYSSGPIESVTFIHIVLNLYITVMLYREYCSICIVGA